jgi:hypothetical protein
LSTSSLNTSLLQSELSFTVAASCSPRTPRYSSLLNWPAPLTPRLATREITPANWASAPPAYAWSGNDGSRHVVVVNYAGNQGQCRLSLPFPELRGKLVRLTDAMGPEFYDRDGTDLVDNGLFIDHGSWHYNVFELRTI